MKDRIIILKTQKYLENHLIVTGVNPEGGRFSALAPAALKSKKRFGGGILEPTHLIEIEYDEPRAEGRLAVVKEARLLDDFKKLREHYDRLSLGLYILQVIEASVQEEPLDSHSLFSLLGHSLKSLETAQDLVSYRRHFEIKFLYTQGLLELTDEVTPALKKRFSEYISFQESCFNPILWERIDHTLQEYLGISFKKDF